jgi:hypothetical protein
VENRKGAEVVVQGEATMEPHSQAPIKFEKLASGDSIETLDQMLFLLNIILKRKVLLVVNYFQCFIFLA